MSTSVAITVAGRVGTEPAAVQEQRLPQLLDATLAGALCASTAPGIPAAADWYRGDDEPAVEWEFRRKDLLSVCEACPVRAACEESALRQGEGSQRRYEDMVRGGRTGPELYQARQDQAGRLAVARTEDARAAREEKELHRLTVQLRLLTLKHRDSRSDSHVSSKIRETARELRAIRAARRSRSGWSNAA
ncbi:hypothetical protein ACWERV_23170 [Streptomyces sp. NPDC004031]